MQTSDDQNTGLKVVPDSNDKVEIELDRDAEREYEISTSRQEDAEDDEAKE